MGNPSEDEQATAAPDSTAGGATNGDQPSRADTTPTNDPAALLAKLSSLTAERDQLDSGDPVAPAAEESSEEEQETVETTEEEQQEETPPATEEAEDETTKDPDATPPKDDSGKGKQFRHRARDDKEEAFLALLKNGKSVPEATEAVYGKGAAAPTQEQQEQTPEAKDPVALARQEVEAIEAELTEAEASYDVEKTKELRGKLRTAERKLVTVEFKAEQAVERTQQTAADAHVAAVESSMDRAAALFPDVVKEGTPLYEAVEDRIAEKKRSNPEFFKDPKWPITLVAEQALELNLPAAKAAPAKPAPPVPPKAAAPKVTPKVTRPVAIAPSSSGRAGSEVTPPDEVDLDHAAEEAKRDPAKGFAFLAAHGQPVLSG